MKKGIGLIAIVLLAVGLIAVSRAPARSMATPATDAATWEAYLPQDVNSDMIFKIFKWDRLSDVAPQDPLSPFQP